MSKGEIISVIKELALTSDFYNKIYKRLISNKEGSEEEIDYYVRQNFKTPLDLIMFIEC